MTKRPGSHLRLVASNGRRIRAVKTIKPSVSRLREEARIREIAERIMDLFAGDEELVFEPNSLARKVHARVAEVRRAVTWLAIRRVIDVVEE